MSMIDTPCTRLSRRWFAAVLAVAATVLVGCWDTPAEPKVSPLPLLQYLTVDATYQSTGRFFIGWTHPQGPNALLNQPSLIRITNRDEPGVARTQFIEAPFDSRMQAETVVEFEYRGGRYATELRITQFDANGRSVTLDCVAPAWGCIYRVD
jgi:hypothetical protein